MEYFVDGKWFLYEEKKDKVICVTNSNVGPDSIYFAEQIIKKRIALKKQRDKVKL